METDGLWHWNLIWILILPLVCLSFHVLTYKPREEPVSLGYWTRWTHSVKCVTYNTAAAAKSLQSCPTLCDPIDSSPPGSPVPGILQARTLEWVAISFSNAWKWEVKVKSLSHAWLLATPWAAAHQAPPSMGFSRQEDWSGCRCLLQVYNQHLLNSINAHSFPPLTEVQKVPDLINRLKTKIPLVS